MQTPKNWAPAANQQGAFSFKEIDIKEDICHYKNMNRNYYKVAANTTVSDGLFSMDIWPTKSLASTRNNSNLGKIY